MKTSDIQAGMTLLLTGTEWIGKDIEWWENLYRHHPRYYSHAVILLAHAPGDLVVWESTWPKVKQTPFPQWLAENTQPISAVLLDARHEWTPAANSRAWTVAQSYEGKWYNAADLAFLAIWEATGKLLPPPIAIGGLVCSIFAATVAKAAFLPDFPELSHVNPNGVDPDSVPELPWVGGVEEVAI